MKIGFIGAGKVGTSLGKLLSENGASISGYFSKSIASATESADFTNSAVFETLEAIVKISDALVLTVPDAAIAGVYQQLCEFSLENKILIHCSGALAASEVFADASAHGAKGISIHPLFPVSSKFSCWQELKDGFFCLEGEETAVAYFESLLREMGAKTKLISSEDKVRYHAACVFSSNLMCGLIRQGLELMVGCGFTEDEALTALSPLINSNIAHVLNVGPAQALTGPIARGDSETVRKHLAVLEGNYRDVYICLSKKLLDMSHKVSAEDFKFLSETFGDAGA